MTSPFEAMADHTRRRILEILAGVELPAGTIVNALQQETTISQPSVSQHLRTLRDSGLVNVRPDGTRRLYSIDRATTQAAIDWLHAVSAPTNDLTQPLEALATEIARGKRPRSESAPSHDRKLA